MRRALIGTAAAVATAAGTWAAVHSQSPGVVHWSEGGGVLRHAGPLASRVLGDGHPVIVLLSGLAASERFWGSAYDRLAEGATVVAIDPLGFGGSMHAEGVDIEADAAEHVEAVRATLAALGLHERPAIIVGHSMGATLALRLAARHAPTTAVIAFDAPLYRHRLEAESRVRGMGWFEALFASGPRAARVCAWMCEHRDLAGTIAVAINPALPASIARDGVRHTWAGYSSAYESLVMDTGWEPAIAALDERSIRILLVDGVDDPVPVPGRAAELAERYPSVTARTLPGGHQLPLTDPVWCAAVIEAVVRAERLER